MKKTRCDTGASAAARARLGVASRVVAAIFGGYALSALAAAVLALVLPLGRAEAVLAGTLASFLVYTGAVMGVFAARTAWRAWGGLAGAGALLGLWGWLWAGWGAA